MVKIFYSSKFILKSIQWGRENWKTICSCITTRWIHGNSRFVRLLRSLGSLFFLYVFPSLRELSSSSKLLSLGRASLQLFGVISWAYLRWRRGGWGCGDWKVVCGGTYLWTTSSVGLRWFYLWGTYLQGVYLLNFTVGVLDSHKIGNFKKVAA